MKLYQATLFSLVLFTSFAQADAENSQWITTWSASPQKVWNKDFVFPTLIPEQVSNQTIRQMSKISLGGEEVRLVFTNQYGKQPLYIDQTTIGLANAVTLNSKSTYPVYFSGQLKARILPGKQLISDPIQLPVPDHAQLVVNSFIQKPTTFKTFHWDAKQTSWLISGNQTTNFTTPTDAKTTTARLLLSAIEVKPKQKAHVVAVVGDSITDGAYDTKQCRQVIAIADRQAHAVIPPRKNAKPWKDTKSSSLERNELLRTVKRLGRILWKKWSGYHWRSWLKLRCIASNY